MNRPIKFMAWHKTNQFWINDSQFIIDGAGFICLYDEDSDEWDTIENTEELVDLYQFTGLLDKEGKEIYEGHIDESGYEFFWNEELGNELYGWVLKDATGNLHNVDAFTFDFKIISHIAEETQDNDHQT